MKAQVGKYAAENGPIATLRKFAKTHPNLKESTVRLWRDSYLKELRKLKATPHSNEVKELSTKKRERPYLLGEKLDKQVRQYLTTLRKAGAVINTAIVLACAEGVVKSEDSNLLACNGGHIVLTRDWGKSILRRMGFVKRRASTSAKVSVENFEVLKAQYLFDIKVIIEMEEIPYELVINWDQTAIHYVPVGSWTMEKEGAQRVEIVGKDDKHQITAVLAGSLTGDFLPPQLVYQGMTKRCISTVNFPQDWDITFSSNHWSNENTMEDYILKILVPYIINKRKELKLREDQRALVIFDQFKGQITDKILSLLAQNNLDIVIVPANCTD